MIACANCRHCRSFWRPTSGHMAGRGDIEHRIRCAAGLWVRPVSRTPRDYAFMNVLRMLVDRCERYVSMNEAPETTAAGAAETAAFKSDLGKGLPAVREFRFTRKRRAA